MLTNYFAHMTSAGPLTQSLSTPDSLACAQTHQPVSLLAHLLAAAEHVVSRDAGHRIHDVSPTQQGQCMHGPTG